jgi:hypothetical protein
VLLDATLLTERYDTVLKQWYYDYRGDVPPVHKDHSA